MADQLPFPSASLEADELFTAPPGLADLEAPATVLPQMSAIRNHIAANATGITRDETIVREVVKVLHAKTHDEIQLQRGRRKYSRFYRLYSDSDAAVHERVCSLFEEARDSVHAAGANGQAWNGEGVLLDAGSLAFVVTKLHRLALLVAERDVLGEAFESLIGPSLRGAEGQFFTPRNLVQMCVEMMQPQPGERILDPACGAGGFLGETLSRLRSVTSRARKGMIVGVDKDAFLATLCADHLALYHFPHAVFCANSLERPERWPGDIRLELRLGSFDLILTNPPFGASIPVKGDLLEQYVLARKWKRSAGQVQPTEVLMASRPPQVLFIERCIQFLRPGGRAAIVLPEGVLGNASEEYIRTWVGSEADLLGVVDCPMETFMPSTPTKTCVVLLRKKGESSHSKVFMAIADSCGHDRRGNPRYREDGSRDDDFPGIAAAFVAGDKR